MLTISDHKTGPMRDSSRIEEDISKLDIFDKLVVYMDYNIHQRFRGYEPVSFETFLNNPFRVECDSLRTWYFHYFQNI